MPIISKCNCGRQWSSVTQAHCAMCHAHFSTVANFDKHKPGPRRPDGSHSCGADRRGGTPRDPGSLTRTKRDGEVVPLLRIVKLADGPTWVSWADDERYVTEEGVA